MKTYKDRTLATVAASNFLFGVVNFIILSLPEGSRLISGNIPPEINRIVKIGKVRWVSEGHTTNYIVHKNVAFEVKVIVSEGSHLNKFENSIIINGHHAYYRCILTKTGIIRRRQLNRLEINFYCNKTKRTLKLQLSSTYSICERDIDAFLALLKDSICH